jgi:hypothetical protein
MISLPVWGGHGRHGVWNQIAGAINCSGDDDVIGLFCYLIDAD